MAYVQALDIYEPLTIRSQRDFPAAPFPYQYMHSVIDDLQHLMSATLALRTAGYDEADIHAMTGQHFVEATGRKARQQNPLARTLAGVLSFLDGDFSALYLHEAQLGHHFLAIRLKRSEQMEQAHKLLARHHAHLIKYVDSWTIRDLPPAPEFGHSFNSAGMHEWKKPIYHKEC